MPGHLSLVSDCKNTGTEKVTAVGKIKILNKALYSEIVHCIRMFRGLPIDCEEVLLIQYPQIDSDVIKDIIQTIITLRTFNSGKRLDNISNRLKKQFKAHVTDVKCDCVLNAASKNGLNPIQLCRALFKKAQSLQIDIKNPYLLSDSMLVENIIWCVGADTQEGPLTDLRRNLVGFEYEALLENWLKSQRIPFKTEKDMRKEGFDKTPDIILQLPILYKGLRISWIESKGFFGDPKRHKKIYNQQLSSYINRFGQGIVIYWHGYHEDTLTLHHNMGISILSTLPDQKDVTFIDLEDSLFKELVPAKD